MTKQSNRYMKTLRYLCLVGVIALGLMTIVGTNGGGDEEGGITDTTPPTVISTSPADGATDVAVDTSITATFSETMDPSTITASTFILSSGGSEIAGSVTYSDKAATFTPSSALDYDTTYTATITTDVQDSCNMNNVPG